MSVQVMFFPGIVLNFLKRVFHCVFLCILRCSCRKRQNVVHEVLFFMCCFSLCRNIKWPPLIFSYSLITRHYIYRCKIISTGLNLSSWENYVKQFLEIEKLIAIKNDRNDKIKKYWEKWFVMFNT